MNRRKCIDVKVLCTGENGVICLLCLEGIFGVFWVGKCVRMGFVGNFRECSKVVFKNLSFGYISYL